MGYAIAEELAKIGAVVTLVSGPVHLKADSKIKVIPVQTAQQMYETCMQHKDYTIAIMAAAVADYTPVSTAPQKIKKEGDTLQIELKKTTDILASLGKIKKDGQLLIGFALETDNEKENALKKLQKKNADIIVLNSMQDKGAGFGHTTNKVTLFTKTGAEKAYETKTKEAVAKDIIDTIIELMK
jgi:phosphopantothenoylcysteine decarboxylase/phosphopantothenate--cysteine ligase